ncbi:hypothetical protein CBR_g28080 [Chara braunii]|uniref:Amine oxidase domain-containing protein n=1 Tax=Chara braunii TaxID=69332 RepID=A0A388L970_CHABU|nr:hypothetical protein CBR_g28080 [Chara braunii]|eukprot:GBG78855.1 hypothetical protein CBR_g28080 [Chara braunii]
MVLSSLSGVLLLPCVSQVFKPKLVPEKVDVIVIGSGIGGLTAAVALSRVGKRVLVLEQHGKAGGCTHVFSKNGYVFDTGLHYLGATLMDASDPFSRIFNACLGWNVTWAKMDPNCYDKIVFGDAEPFSFREGKSALAGELNRRFPADAAAVRQILGLQRKVEMAFGKLVLWKLLPEWLRSRFPFLARALLCPVANVASKTAYETLRQFTDNEELIGVLLSQWANYNLPPKESSFLQAYAILMHYLSGAVYPCGGSISLANAMVPIIEGAGGKVLTRVEVQQVLVNQRSKTVEGVRVRTRSGEVMDVPCPTVVSSAGALVTFKRFLSDVDSGGEIAKRVELLERKVGMSRSMFSLFLGLKGSSEDLGLPSGNLWFHPSYQFDRRIRLERRPQSHVGVQGGDNEGKRSNSQGEDEKVDAASAHYTVAKELSWCIVDTKGLPEEERRSLQSANGVNSRHGLDSEEVKLVKEPERSNEGNFEIDCLFISFPSVKDPESEVQHPGGSTCCVLAPTDYSQFQKWAGSVKGKRGTDYEDIKKDLATLLTAMVLERFPQLEGKVDYVDLGTPLTIEHYLKSLQGAPYGLAFSPVRFAPEVQQILCPETPIKGLYLAGQDTMVNGIAGAHLGGLLAAAAISKWCLLDLFWEAAGWTRKPKNDE